MRTILTTLALLLMAVWHMGARATEPGTLPPVVVYAPSPCLACVDWADHLRQHGFTVTVEEKLQADMPRIKRWLNVPSALESVHTAKVGRYFIEGHVPAADIRRLVAERPAATGLTVPGMPFGSPGMGPEAEREAYDVLLVGLDGSSSMFTSYPAA